MDFHYVSVVSNLRRLDKASPPTKREGIWLHRRQVLNEAQCKTQAYNRGFIPTQQRTPDKPETYRTFIYLKTR
jgi:hypothetical protein